ncbi:hypothetical protein EV1_041529 [Malus domestica]
MYLNDCQRTTFYQGIGLNTKEFDMHVIIETNRTTARIFPAVLDVENSEFERKLDRMVEINQKLIAVGESDDEDEIEIVKSLPEPLREFASQFLIELASKAASSNLVFVELIKCSSKMGLSYLIPNAQVQMAPPVLHIPSRIVVFYPIDMQLQRRWRLISQIHPSSILPLGWLSQKAAGAVAAADVADQMLGPKEDKHLAIVLVGLPARGKAFTAAKLTGYLRHGCCL